MKKCLYIFLLTVIFHVTPLVAWSDTNLECEVIRGSTGTNLLEILITDKKICMGDTSMSPTCANIDGKLEPWQKDSQHGKVYIKDRNYDFQFFLNSKRLLYDVILNRYTAKAVVTYFTKSNETDYVAVFQCRKVSTKRKF